MNTEAEANQEEPLLAASSLADSGDSGDAPAQPLEAGAVRKLQCLICMLGIIVVGLVASLNEARALQTPRAPGFHSDGGKQDPWYMADSPTDWISWCIKCALLSMAILSFVYLQRRVLLPGKIPRASFRSSAASGQRPLTVLKNVHYYLELPKSFASYPSKLFVTMFVIFALLGGLCGLSEAICGLMDVADPSIYKLIPYFEVFRCLLLAAFICAQTAFFVRHNRACIQWKLDGVWLAVCLIIGTNISTWFFYVQLEIRESMEAKNHTRNASSLRTIMDSVEQIFSPFLIEFFLMGAILAGGILSNAGRLARVLQQQQQQRSCISLLTPDSIRMLLKSRRSKPPGGYWRQHRGSLAFGLALVTSALAASIVLKLVLNPQHETLKLVLNYLQSVLYMAGIGFSGALLWQFSSSSDRHGAEKPPAEAGGHAADRLLLWCGALAVLVNNLYWLWSCLADHCSTWTGRVSTAAVALPNICQSILQVYVLECILVRQFQPRRSVQTDGRRGDKLLTVLMLINAAEWLVSSVAFNILFADSHDDTINLVIAVCSMPLQVFFRFHSIACIHEFRKHCTESRHAVEAPAASGEPIEFPSLTPRSYGIA